MEQRMIHKENQSQDEQTGRHEGREKGQGMKREMR